MKSIKHLALTGAVALLAATSLSAQSTHLSTPDTRPLGNDYNRTVATENGYLTKANKASGLIGMNVRNDQNQKLGDIKDLVVDLQSGRIAYAVLSVGGFLGIGDKYIAVPPSEFHLGPDGKELILNADKARIESAPGFAKNNWPAWNDPTWRTHSSYWLPQGTALGTPGSTYTGRDTGGTLGNADLGTYSGRVVAIDGAAKTITLDGASGKRTFRMDNRATVSMRNDAHARLESLHINDHVTVRFHQVNGSDVADSVSDSERVVK